MPSSLTDEYSWDTQREETRRNFEAIQSGLEQLLPISSYMRSSLQGGLTSTSGSLEADVSLGVNTETLVFSTTSLAVGSWLVNVCLTVRAGSASVIETRAAVNTATATLTGAYAGSSDLPSGSTDENIALSFIATVTVAGTLKITARGSSGTSNTVGYRTRNNTYSPASGYTAVRIA